MNQRSMDDKTVALFRGNLVAKSFTLLIKKVLFTCRLSRQDIHPHGWSSSKCPPVNIWVVDLHWGPTRFWQLSADYHRRSTRLLSSYQPDSENHHQCHHLSTNHNQQPSSTLKAKQAPIITKCLKEESSLKTKPDSDSHHQCHHLSTNQNHPQTRSKPNNRHQLPSV